MASYRYRCEIPAKSLGAEINNSKANVLIFAKPMAGDLEIAKNAKKAGSKIVVDFCDDHFSDMLYRNMIDISDQITVITPEMALLISNPAYLIPDTYEFEERAPHCNGANLLWFGHKVNYPSFQRLNLGCLVDVVSNVPGATPWSLDALRKAFKKADIVLMPATAGYKSPNRTLEAIRQGCFVVAEPHPSLRHFPIWKGDIYEGLAWAISHHTEANQMILKAQDFIKQNYSPAIQADAWRTALRALG